MNPLTGIWPACATVPGYRYASPDGERYPATILHSTFFILHWTYTFSAKERDPETGLSYFGSRYYSRDLSAWLSVDLKSDKYPSLSYFSGATAADVGNFHAGYVGEIAGFSKYVLWKGAGGAETYKAFDNGHIAEGLWRLNGFISPLNIKSGDRWRDFRFNTKGMNAAKKTIQ